MTPLTQFTTANFFNLNYVNELGKAGSASFSVKVKDPKATTDNLKLFNKVKIYKDAQFKWSGFIENISCDLNRIDIKCSGMLNIFAKRNLSYSTTMGQPLTSEFYKILNVLTNNVDDTYIDQGVSESVININVQEFNDASVLSAFEKLADLDNKLLQIDENNQLNLLTKIGSDKSNSIIFQYAVNQIVSSTIFEFNLEIDGKDMANSVAGKAENLSSYQSDAVSIAEFGRLETRENFGGTKNITDLQRETLSYLENHKYEIITPTLKPNPLKINPDSYDIGDTVKVFLDNGFVSVNQNHDIIRKSVNIKDSGFEDVEIDLIPSGSNILKSNFFREINKMNKRLITIEGIVLK